MKALLMTAVLAVALIGGAALAVPDDDSGPHVSVASVDSIGIEALALTPETTLAHKQTFKISGFLGVPAFAPEMISTNAWPVGHMLTDKQHRPEPRRSQHFGKLTATAPFRDDCRACHRLHRSHPLLC